MLWGIVFIIVLVVGTLVAWYVFDRALYWHEDKRDPRNVPPPR